MSYSDQYKCVFIHIPKNAGTSIIKAFKLEQRGHLEWDRYQQEDPERFRNYFKFAVVRNPYDRFVSAYEYARMLRSYYHSPDGSTQYGIHLDYEKLKESNFLTATRMLAAGQLEHKSFIPQHHWIYSAKTLMVDQIVRMENLAEDLEYVASKLQISPTPQLEIWNPSTRNKSQPYYNAESLRIVGEYYQQDFELLNYHLK
jgi:hypothetical protein